VSDTFIERVPAERDFTIIRNQTLQNSNLSFGARGLLSYLLSLPKGWKVPKADDLTKYSTDGREKIYSLIRELMRAGHFHRFKFRSPDGAWGSVCFVLEVANHSYDYSKWLSANPKAVDPKTVEPEAYKERKRKKQNTTYSDAPRRKPRRPPKVRQEETAIVKKVGKYRFTLNTNISPEFTSHAESLGLSVYEIGWVFNSFRQFWAIKKANVQQPAEWWLEQWKKSISRYIEFGRKYKNKTDFNYGGNGEQQYGEASNSRAEQLRRIVTEPDSLPRIFIGED
jgi:hypothetical protein